MPKIFIESDLDGWGWNWDNDSDRIEDAVADADYDERSNADWGRFLIEVPSGTVERWTEIYQEAQRAMSAVQDEIQKLVSDKRELLEGEI